MTISVKIKPNQSEAFESICPLDRVIEADDNYMCCLADIQLLITEDMVEEQLWPL